MKFFHAFSVYMILPLFLTIQSCKQTEFTARGGAAREPASATPTPTVSYAPPTPALPNSPTPVPSTVPTVPVVTAVECNATTIRWARETSQCPAGYAAFSLDDAKETSIACCPLPAADIFTADVPTVRVSTCATGEVAVGGSANGGLLCQKINLTRYALAAMQPTCYYGSGAAGGSGSQVCSAPPVTLQAMATKFGSDACLPVPYGALITSHNKNGKCADAHASVLFFRDTGMVVPMFK